MSQELANDWLGTKMATCAPLFNYEMRWAKSYVKHDVMVLKWFLQAISMKNGSIMVPYVNGLKIIACVMSSIQMKLQGVQLPAFLPADHRQTLIGFYALLLCKTMV